MEPQAVFDKVITEKMMPQTGRQRVQLAELFLIGLYFLIRLILHGDEVISIDSSRKYRILLGVIWVPILTGSYWYSILDYDPCSFCAPPMHISIFLGLLAFIVTDCLYQFLMLSKNAETATIEN